MHGYMSLGADVSKGAAGYDLRTEKQCAYFFKELDQKIDYDLILNFHLNDSKGSLGSHLDRHAILEKDTWAWRCFVIF